MKVVPPQGSSGPLRFLVDEHLGRLGRHLRLPGFDTESAPSDLPGGDLGDQKLVDHAKDSHRVLLTRDHGLVARAQKAGVSVHLVQATHPDEQFREVIAAFGVRELAATAVGFLTRCLECNATVHRMPPESAQGRVPADIYESQDEFFCCQRCERVYWKGSHYGRMVEWLKRHTQP
jgi:uncharacterized protein with PIN domain